MRPGPLLSPFLPTGRLDRRGYGLTVLTTAVVCLLAIQLRGPAPLLAAPLIGVYVLGCANARRLRAIGASQWWHGVPIGLWTAAIVAPFATLRWVAAQSGAHDDGYGEVFGALVLFIYTGGAAAVLSALFMLKIALTPDTPA